MDVLYYCLATIFVNKVYGNTITVICLLIVYGHFYTIMAQLSSGDRVCATKPKIFITLPFTEKVCQLLH